MVAVILIIHRDTFSFASSSFYLCSYFVEYRLAVDTPIKIAFHIIFATMTGDYLERVLIDYYRQVQTGGGRPIAMTISVVVNTTAQTIYTGDQNRRW